MSYAIAAGHKLTRDTAKLIIENGGNAFDAAIAAYAVMFIAEPAMASAGASGLAVCFDKESGRRLSVDFFSHAPLVKRNFPEMDYHAVQVNFSDAVEEFHVGLAAATVPGTIAGIFKIHELFGSIPVKDLFSPAIEKCKSGVALDAFQAYDLSLLQDILRLSPVGEDIFFKNGEIKKEGDKIYMSSAADFLGVMAREGMDEFYRGEIARKVAADARARGAHLTRKDFEDYRVHVRKPLRVQSDDLEICTPSGSSIGSYGLLLYWGLCHVKGWTDCKALEFVMKHIRDPEIMRARLSEIYPSFSPDLNTGSFAPGGTSHFSIVDKSGNAIALTTSLGEGCGYFIPGTEMHLNNMLGETYLLPNNAHSWLPNTRLNSMMTPTLVFRNGGLFLVSGSGGASRIPGAIKQVLSRLLDNGTSLEDATEAPRMHYQESRFQFENGYEPETPVDEQYVSRWTQRSLYFGGVNSIMCRNGGAEAWSDQRRLGSAGVYG